MSEKKPIPVIRANGRDIDAMIGFHAAMTEIEESGKILERRFRAVPNGWRDYRLMRTLLDKLTDQTLDTYPFEKLVTLRRMLPRVRFKITVGPQATSNVHENETLLSYDDLDTLTTFAREQCKMCIDWDCDRCKLGKTLDHVLRHDRNGGCWATIPYKEDT